MEDLLSQRLAAPATVTRTADEALSGKRALDLRGLAERIEKLNLAAQATRLRVEEQRRRLDVLRAGIEDLGGGLSAVGNGAEALSKDLRRPQPASPPLAAAAALSAPAASRPVLSLPAVEEEERLRRRPDVSYFPETTPSSWTRPLVFAPYAAIAAVAVALSCAGPWQRTLAQRLPSVRLSPPQEAPAAPPSDAAAAAAGPDLSMPSDDATEDAVLKLVYSYRPGGAGKAVSELLAPEIDAAAESDAEAWVVEPGDPGHYLVTFRPDASAGSAAPIYEFDVDLAAKSVAASPETEEALRDDAVAAR